MISAPHEPNTPVGESVEPMRDDQWFLDLHVTIVKDFEGMDRPVWLGGTLFANLYNFHEGCAPFGTTLHV